MTVAEHPVAEKPDKSAKGKKTPAEKVVPAWQDPDRLPQTVESLEAALVDARAEAQRLDDEPWLCPGEKGYDEHQANVAAAEKAIADLTQRIDAARVKALPLPEPMAATANFELRTIPINQIHVTGNHREDDNPAQNEQLARSFKTHGLQQPIGVRVAGIGAYELIFGSRRRRAAMAAGWTEIMAKIYPMELTPFEVEVLRTIENFGKKDLTAIERVIAVGRCYDAAKAGLEPLCEALRDVVGDPSPDRYARVLLHVANHDVPVSAAIKPALDLALTIVNAGGLEAYIGQQLSHSAAWVKDQSYIARLGGETRKLLAAGRLSLAHARELAKLGDAKTCDDLAEEVAKDAEGLGGLSVEITRNRVIERLRSLKTVPWRLDVAFGRGVAGCTGYACTMCQFNSRSDPDLFGGSLADEPEAGFCTHVTCFSAKKQIAEQAVVTLTKEGKAMVKKSGLAATEVTLGGLVADKAVYVKPAVVARAVKRELEQGPKLTAADGSKRSPEQIAQEKLNSARSKWQESAARDIGKAMGKVPGASLLFSLINGHGGAWKAADPGWEPKPDRIRKAEEAVNSERFQHMLKCLKSPELKHFVEAEKAREDSVSAWMIRNVVPAAAIALAEAFSLKLPPPPTMEQFLPKAAKPDTKPADKKAAKPTGKPAKAKKSAKPKPMSSMAADYDDFDDE
jgi:hypothetical protein